MTLVALFMFLLIAGVALSVIEMEPRIKDATVAVVLMVAVLGLLSYFGVFTMPIARARP